MGKLKHDARSPILEVVRTALKPRDSGSKGPSLNCYSKSDFKQEMLNVFLLPPHYNCAHLLNYTSDSLVGDFRDSELL